MKVTIITDGRPAATMEFRKGTSIQWIGRWAHDRWPDAQKVEIIVKEEV